MQDDPYAERKKLTFAQAEGVERVPSQLALKEVSQELRARLWRAVYHSLLKYSDRGRLHGPWLEALYSRHVEHEHRMADEFDYSFAHHHPQLKSLFEQGSYIVIFDFLQYVLRQPSRPYIADEIRRALEDGRAAYRLLDDDRTIVPITSEAELDTLNRVFVDLDAAEFHGAGAHLKKAAEHLSAGKSADSIRESIHAVESVANAISGAKTLGDALGALEKKAYVHPALKKGFSSLYGFTSDEKGIRHALLEKDAAEVDETDAIFMIGACASFVSYLINKNRAASHSS